ncbi:IQ motif and SEC7 domain-containing protein 3 isoform X1 [Astyanax mexicanus]|uniref:IQ motif and SEC7 domain-containing protein 3 isoform X1 n=1 Tax=Astyanax mexicanus TaxID=7994 RepID=UPI0020CB3370|nr:IQ motif and SEC7 domain-containing protein 3 isoform X1 [Astyanax mexicanus]
MSSLLENPLQAILYLKELTAIVQNQQSLIQTQRHRIDALERRLGDLLVENRQLRDSTHRHPPRHHPPPPPRTSSLPRAAQHHAAAPAQPPQQQQQQHSPQDMQLVPAVPASTSPDSSPEDAREPCCRSLVPQSAGTLCRAVGIPRSSESQTVLHQFCCPAPEAPEGDPIGCSSSVHAIEGEVEKEQKKSAQLSPPPCSHTATYELSPDLKQKQIEELEQKYGGPLISRRAACKIQTAFRQYQLSKNFQKIRNSVLESGIPRRMSVRRVRVQRDGFSAERALMEGCSLMGIPLTHSTSLPTGTSNTLTHLEDSFNEQVQSLARSIDEALSSWSTVHDGEGEGALGASGAQPPGPSSEGLLMGSTSIQETTQNTSAEGIPRSASKLMMAFRDVTVQIDNHNFRLSSSVLESVSLGNGVSKETASEPHIGGLSGIQSETSATVEPEFPAPPPSEELGLDQPLTGDEGEASQEKPQANQGATEGAENSSDPISSSSTSTSACETMILSLPRTHCPDTHCGTLSTDIARKRLYRIGLNLFNINPDKGIQFLISRGFIPDTPIGVAHFLLQRKGLSRQMIGEFLGNSKRQFNRDVLDCVVDEMDFSMLELDEALRKFQAHVRVQGEAQKVERLIEAFSQRYCMCNPDVVQQFHNPDTIFILAFAIVLLNTDMYSPNIKPERKMLLEDFIRNLRGVDDGADIPREMVAGIYERIQQRELRSNEDHVTYVTRVEQSIQGMKTILSVPHRRLVCCSRLYEVTDVHKHQKQAAHQREVFLFNDLIVILKLCPKKKSAATYTFCKAMGLLGMQFHLFENEYYPHGITILSPFSSEKKQVVSFCSQSSEELLKFVEDLRESIAEVAEMEHIRIEWELERQQAARNQSAKNNGTQLEIHRPMSPAGDHDFFDKTGGNAVEVSIHNRLQTYQLSSPLAPPSAQQQLAILPSTAPGSALTISPDTLIQCQQIVKVIVVDSAGRGRVEAFLSQNPAHRLIQSAVSTPIRSREGGSQQPPLPPPPPPYHHKHQFCPPTPPPPQHMLSQRSMKRKSPSLDFTAAVIASSCNDNISYLYQHLCK